MESRAVGVTRRTTNEAFGELACMGATGRVTLHDAPDRKDRRKLKWI